jgi:transposase
MTDNEKIADVVYLMAKGYNYTAISVMMNTSHTQIHLWANKAIDAPSIVFNEKKSTTFSKIKTAEDRLWILKDLLAKDPFNWKLIDEWKALSKFYSESSAL